MSVVKSQMRVFAGRKGLPALPSAHKINQPCDPTDFDGVLEIPMSELRPEKYRNPLTVDVVEPNRVADIVRS
jgi:hypothetical protein